MSSWNSLCISSVEKEKAEIAERYGIRFGQTEIYCVHCGRPIANPLNHTCQDIRLKKLNEAKKENHRGTPELCLKLKKLGVKKASVRLYEERNGVPLRDVTEEAVRSWIKRGNVPIEYQEPVHRL